MKTQKLIALLVLFAVTVESRVFMIPYKFLGFPGRDETTTEAPTTTTQNPLIGLSKEACERQIEEGYRPKVEPWYFYPQDSECWNFAIMETFNFVSTTTMWKKGWYEPICDRVHNSYRLRKLKTIVPDMKERHCK